MISMHVLSRRCSASGSHAVASSVDTTVGEGSWSCFSPCLSNNTKEIEVFLSILVDEGHLDTHVGDMRSRFTLQP